MFTPFRREEGLLNQDSFQKDEVRFQLVHRIAEDPEGLMLKALEGKALALQNTGRRMWLWLSDTLTEQQNLELIDALAHHLKNSRLPGFAGQPEQAFLFAKTYACLTGAAYREAMSIESYECPEVIWPSNVPGRIIASGPEHVDTVAEYLVGFIQNGFGKTVLKESQLAGAQRLTSSQNLWLWEVEGTVVSMANIAHRSPRHGRINQVYTPHEKRKRGYASALVAAISQKLLDEGLTPVLYADILYGASNKVYRSIGYKERGSVTEYDFVYKDALE